MTFELITPPALEPFSLADLKAAMRIDHEADDALAMRLGVTARRFVERRLGFAIGEQTWRLRLPGAASEAIRLRPAPIVSVDIAEVFYGASETGRPADEAVLSRAQPSLLTLRAPSAVEGERARLTEVTFTAGHRDITAVPAELTEAIISLAAHYYEHRALVEAGRYVAMPAHAEALLQAFREVRL